MKEFKVYRGDLRIPYVAAWEHERANIILDPLVNREAAYHGGLDHAAEAEAGLLGRPELGKMAPQRQRQAMLKGLCQVCALPMRTMIVLGDIAPRGPDKLVSMDEPPCCPACALVAVSWCPFARKAWERRGGWVLEEADYALQMARIRKDDLSFPRPIRRRWADKPVVVHARLKPIRLMPIEGEAGVLFLQGLVQMQGDGR